MATDFEKLVEKMKSGKARWGALALAGVMAISVAGVASPAQAAKKKITIHKVWVAADIGPVVNMSGAENQFQGAVLDAVSTMMGLEITMENGRIQQNNFLGKSPLCRINLGLFPFNNLACLCNLFRGRRPFVHKRCVEFKIHWTGETSWHG